MKRTTRLGAIVHEKCPRCRQGAIFAHSPFKLLKFSVMHRFCPHCNLRFEIEPGFFYGSMYFSYVFMVAFVIPCGLLIYFIHHETPMWVYMLTVLLVITLTAPFSFRYSRVLWLYIFSGVAYEENNE